MRPDNPAAERKDQTPDHRPTPLAAPTASRVTSSAKGARASLNLHLLLSQKLDDGQALPTSTSESVPLSAAVHIVEAHDVVLAEIAADLHLDQFERNLA